MGGFYDVENLPNFSVFNPFTNLQTNVNELKKSTVKLNFFDSLPTDLILGSTVSYYQVGQALKQGIESFLSLPDSAVANITTLLQSNSTGTTYALSWISNYIKQNLGSAPAGYNNRFITLKGDGVLLLNSSTPTDIFTPPANGPVSTIITDAASASYVTTPLYTNNYGLTSINLYGFANRPQLYSSATGTIPGSPWISNHMQREEIIECETKDIGYSTRISDTNNAFNAYVAYKLELSDITGVPSTHIYLRLSFTK